MHDAASHREVVGICRHPIHIAALRLAKVRRQALCALLAVAAAPMLGAVAAIISLTLLGGRP